MYMYSRTITTPMSIIHGQMYSNYYQLTRDNFVDTKGSSVAIYRKRTDNTIAKKKTE